MTFKSNDSKQALHIYINYDVLKVFQISVGETVKQQQIYPLGVSRNSSHGKAAKRSCAMLWRRGEEKGEKRKGKTQCKCKSTLSCTASQILCRNPKHAFVISYLPSWWERSSKQRSLEEALTLVLFWGVSSVLEGHSNPHWVCVWVGGWMGGFVCLGVGMCLWVCAHGLIACECLCFGQELEHIFVVTPASS